MKKIIICIISLLCLTPIQAKDGKKILDEAVEKIFKSGDITIGFNATSYNGTSEQNSTSGKMCLQGRRYYFETPEMTAWFDGKTQWCYVPENGEVNITEPTERELQVVNPYCFLDIYKKNYKINAKSSTLRGEETYEVHLTAEKTSMDPKEMYIDVRKSDYQILCIRIRQGNDWTRLAITSFQGKQHFGDATFEFPKDKYPDAELIDLR